MSFRAFSRRSSLTQIFVENCVDLSCPFICTHGLEIAIPQDPTLRDSNIPARIKQ